MRLSVVTWIADLTIKLLRHIWRRHYSLGRLILRVVNVAWERSLRVVLHGILLSKVVIISHLRVILICFLIVPVALTVDVWDWVLPVM